MANFERDQNAANVEEQQNNQTRKRQQRGSTKQDKARMSGTKSSRKPQKKEYDPMEVLGMDDAKFRTRDGSFTQLTRTIEMKTIKLSTATYLAAMSASGAFNTQTNDSERIYGDGTNSSIGAQINTYYYDKKALIEIAKEQFFGQLADTTSMPKHMGKKIKKYLYLPLLDDRNINDQGIDATGATIANGNLYGSSKDIGTIVGKLPTLTEHGGRVNRVGFKRIEVEGTMAKFGFFDEYSQESIDFDTDAQLQMHIRRESTRGANEITEAQLQVDLLNAAGVVRFGGAATQDAEVTGEASAVISVPTYEGLMKTGITLDDNKAPKNTKIITGSRLVDTKTIDNARYIYVGSEMIPTLKRMKDLHNEKAFVEARHYAAAGTLAKGEIGAIDQFRFYSCS